MPKFDQIDDELDEAVATKKPAAKPAADDEGDEVDEKPAAKPTATAATSKKAAAAAADDGDDVDWGDEKTMSLSGGLDRLRPEKGKAVRFAIIPWIKPKKALTHFIDKKGTYRCLATEDESGYCCKKLAEDGSVTVVALVLHYTNAPSKDGKYRKDEQGRVPPIEWGIKYVQLGKTNFRDISELPPEGSNVTDIDIVMAHKGENGIGYKFTLGATAARWRQNPDLVQEVREACEKFLDGKKLASKLGKKVTLAEMKAVLATLTAGAEDQSLDDVEEL